MAAKSSVFLRKTLLLQLLLCCGAKATSQDYKSFPMWNASLPPETRINDLISRLTLEEKVAQMLNATPAVPRLGIPAYDWWNEVLHGVARTPYKVTSYPQAIAMAATWDTNSLRKMADQSATEGRAVYGLAMQQGRNHERYMGLTYWTPNINIFRDPRWGRGQETYGEDPFLTAKLGAAFVRGLQGNHPYYLKAAACAKHFAVHSGPEPTRHSDNFNPSTYDLWDTYLPAFRELITKAGVAGVMCAYNAIYGQPCCASDVLMTDILRRRWKFTGYVTSDCWALDDFYKYHKTHPDTLSAALDALVHTTDLECGHVVYKKLYDAVKSSRIAEAQLDSSLRRLFAIRYRLGMFDPPAKVPYARITANVLEAPEHKAHALHMARQCMVLLKNENQTLPLSKKLKKIAVVGPNADNRIAVLGNYNGMPSRVVTVLDGLKEKLGSSTEIVFEKAINFTNDTLLLYDDISRLLSIDGKPGVKAEYFNNKTLEGNPQIVQWENEIDHYWPEGQTPAPGIGTLNFSARYTTYLRPEIDGLMHFEAEADDGYRVYINDSLWINAWTRNRWGARQFSVPVQKGQPIKIVMEYYQGEGNALVKLKSGRYVKTDFNQLAERLKDADAIIFVGGISPQLEGEEMPVDAPGFLGGDRTSIRLPAVQTQLMKALKQTGKPVIFVMMTGSAIAIPWEQENIPAILNAWYAGQSAGTAVADVLFGDYNPAGRLPVTFYKSDNDLPDFKSYDMSRRTYRYFNGDVLYPFGYGLSYTQFRYSHLSCPATSGKGKTIMVSARVTNTGSRDGEEVVQLYVTHNDYKGRKPIRALKGFQRIFLKAGQSKNVSFRLTPDELSLVHENSGELFQPSGVITISIGGGQPNMPHATTSNVITKKILIK
ncbi:MAG: glycoside hydrolase family 3 C-terminal domain-containing protein [Chitinophagaceae bacterium]|nr:glycoside hydrolase family 3 C-terminal domain-containing protein [Chitinophagaceae bacterium]